MPQLDEPKPVSEHPNFEDPTDWEDWSLDSFDEPVSGIFFGLLLFVGFLLFGFLLFNFFLFDFLFFLLIGGWNGASKLSSISPSFLLLA